MLPELCRAVWAYLTAVPPVAKRLTMPWWPLWQAHVIPYAMGVRNLYSSRDMLATLSPWPPHLHSHRLVWWGHADVVVVQLATLDLVVAPITSIMHVHTGPHTWERHVRTQGWGDLIHARAGTVFHFGATGQRVRVTHTWRLQLPRTGGTASVTP